jgi:ankyrin repeat protein
MKRWIFAALLAAFSVSLGAPAAQAGPSAHTLLHAVEQGNVQTIELELAKGANPNDRSAHPLGWPLLLVAVLHSQPEAIRILLRHGANPDARDARGTPLLVSAAGFDRLPYIRILIEEGHANVNVHDLAEIGDGRSAIHQAAARGDLPLLTLLIKNGARVDAEDRYGETPLYFAAQYGNLEAARLLLSQGANPNSRTRFTAMTPLLAAAEGAHAQLAKLLLASAADPKARNAFGQSARDLLHKLALARLPAATLTR